MENKNRESSTFSGVDVAVGTAIKMMRSRSGNEIIPDEWWEQVGRKISDTRSWYLFGYQSPTIDGSLSRLREQVAVWHKEHKSQKV